MGELTKTDNAGKNSPGPVYIYADKIKYDEVSQQIQSRRLQHQIILFRRPDGQWEQKLELEKINPDMTFMKMLFSSMTQSRLILTEKADA